MWRDYKIHQMDLRNGDIQLRLARKDDAALISGYFLKNRQFLKPWEPKREEAFFTEQGWKKKLIKLCELHALNLGFYCLIIDLKTGEMLGTVSFSNLVRFPLHSCNVGYSLDENAQGRGVMRQALKMACDWMFRVQNLHRISASYMPHNLKSEAVLFANGFEPVGYAKDYLLIDGRWQDHKLTSLINSEWQDNNE